MRANIIGLAALGGCLGVGATAACFSSSSPNAPSVDAGGGYDASIADAGQGDTNVLGPEASFLDASSDASDARAEAETGPPPCEPGSVAAFEAGAFVGPTGGALPCGQSFNPDPTIANFAAACIAGDASFTSCSTYLASDAATPSCLACIATPPDAGNYGAAILYPEPLVNYSDCVARVVFGDAGTVCAEALQAAAACASFACAPSCPVTDDTSQAAYETCVSAAATGACSAYAQAAQACVAAAIDAGSPVAENCYPGPTAVETFEDIASFYCTGS